MATVALLSTTTPPRRRSHAIRHLVISWVIAVPFVFFAAHGNFSWEDTANNLPGKNSLAALALPTRHLGFLGYIVIPGIAYSIVVWLILINAKRVLALSLQMKVITLLALLTIFSAAWSQNPFRSAYNGVFYLIDTLFAFYLVLKFDPEEILSLVMVGGVALSVLNLVMVFLFPHFALVHEARDLGAWQGAFGDRTSAAKAMVFLLSPALVLRRRRHSLSFRNVVYIVAMSVMIFMTKSATADIVLIVYVIFIAYISIFRRFGRRSSLVITTAFLTAAAFVVYVSFPYLPLMLESVGRNATLTGRTVIWDFVLRSVEKRPLLGYGYYAFWQGLTGESASLIVAANWVFGYAHNGVLEICLQLGLVGTAVFFATLFQAIRNAWFCLCNGCPPGVEWYMGIIAITIMYNIDEATVVWPNDLLSILYVVACCGLAQAARRIKHIQTMEPAYK
jgi:exopolysaccharide production protein ExoQ